MSTPHDTPPQSERPAVHPSAGTDAHRTPANTGSFHRPACGTSHPHESAAAQVAGAAPYIDDIPEVRGTLHAAPILSPAAHGRLKGVNARAALANKAKAQVQVQPQALETVAGDYAKQIPAEEQAKPAQ